MRYQRTANGDVTVMAQKKGGADGVSKPTNGIAGHDAMKVKALLKCTTRQRDEHLHHHNGSVVNGMYYTVCILHHMVTCTVVK